MRESNRSPDTHDCAFVRGRIFRQNALCRDTKRPPTMGQPVANDDTTIRRQPPIRSALPFVIVITGLYVFCTSFFLAKRSLAHQSTCANRAAGPGSFHLLSETLGLTDSEVARMKVATTDRDCWVDRRVGKMLILVVDALRFDFAKERLPRSLGKRLSTVTTNRVSSTDRFGSSQLMQFTADPPTVTMQRLKGLTTGGLPTFADISGNLGGGYVDEDSWVAQLVRRNKTAGFVGDDTWIDLFADYFEKQYPYPSFNTRDLNTVDEGCWEHLPELLNDLREGRLDLVVAHFLGVDHVGHTYGPHTEFMDEKLGQIDSTLESVLDEVDGFEECSVVFVFGDHGMTEDGNHGGGSPEEVGAALFTHFSPTCNVTAQDIMVSSSTRCQKSTKGS